MYNPAFVQKASEGASKTASSRFFATYCVTTTFGSLKVSPAKKNLDTNDLNKNNCRTLENVCGTGLTKNIV